MAASHIVVCALAIILVQQVAAYCPVGKPSLMSYGRLIINRKWLTVLDHSFESVSVPPGERVNHAPGWMFANASGVRHLLASQLNPGVMVDGSNTAWANKGALWQQLSENIAGGHRYQLNVKVFSRIDTPLPPYSIQLRAGGQILAETMVPVATGASAWAKVIFSTEVGSNNNWAIGQPLTIYLMGTGKEVNFDNVTVSKQACTAQSSTSTTTSSSTPWATNPHEKFRTNKPTPRTKNIHTTHTHVSTPTTTTTPATPKAMRTTRMHTSEVPSSSTSSSSAFDGPNPSTPAPMNRKQTITGVLDGLQVSPPVYTTALGIFSLSLQKSTVLRYNVQVFGVALNTQPSAGLYKASGQLVLSLAAPYMDQATQSLMFAGESQAMTTEQLGWLASGSMYIKIKNTVHPWGLIQGAIQGFNSLLFPATTTTPAQATVSMPNILHAASIHLNDTHGHSGVALLNIDDQFTLRFTVLTAMYGSFETTMAELRGPSAKPWGGSLLETFTGQGKTVTGTIQLTMQQTWDLKNNMLYITAFGQNAVVIAGQITGFANLYIPSSTVPTGTPYLINTQDTFAGFFIDGNSINAGSLVVQLENIVPTIIDLDFVVNVNRPAGTTVTLAAFVDGSGNVLHSFIDAIMTIPSGLEATGVWYALSIADLNLLTSDNIWCKIMLLKDSVSETLTVQITGFVHLSPTTPPNPCSALPDNSTCNPAVGTFFADGLMPVTTSLSTVIYSAAADLTGDGKPDIVGVDSIRGVVTYFPEWKDPITHMISFGTGTPVFTVNPNVPVKVLLMDANMDGHIDIFTIFFGSGVIELSLNNGTGSFTATPSIVFSGKHVHDLTFLDVNNDGKKDLVVVQAATQISSCLAHGDGTYDAPLSLATAPQGGWSIVAADLTNDGFQDLVAVFTSDYNVYWFENNQDGTFSAMKLVGALTRPLQVEAADMNGDGYKDIVAAGSLGVFVYYAKAGGVQRFDSTMPAKPLWLGPTDKAFDLADFNQDGMMDVAVTDFSQNLVLYLRQAPGNHFIGNDISTSFKQPTSIHGQDIDGDGVPDMLISFFGTGSVMWAKNGELGKCDSGTCIGGPHSTAAPETTQPVTAGPVTAVLSGEYNLLNFNDPSFVSGFGNLMAYTNDTLSFSLYSMYMLPSIVQIVLDDQITLFNVQDFTFTQSGSTTVTMGRVDQFTSWDRSLLVANRLKVVLMPSNAGAAYVGTLSGTPPVDGFM